MIMIYLVLSSLCLALLYGVYRLAMSRTTLHRFNRIILLSILVLSAILPAIRISAIGAIGDSSLLHVQNSVDEATFSVAIGDSPLLHVLEYDGMETFSGSKGDSPQLHTRVATGVKVVETVTQMDWVSIITYLYLMGVAFFMIRLLIGITRAETLCRLGGRELPDGSRLLVCDGEFQPTSWRRTVIMSRRDFESAESDIIIEHELTHIHCRHSIDVVISQIACALQWFNPAAWALKRSLQEVHEYEADANVLADGENERRYQICLVQAALGSRIGYVTSNFADCSTKKRITMMKRNQSSPFACFKALLLLPAVAVIILLASACKSDAAQGNSDVAQSEPAIESAPAPAVQPTAQSVAQKEPFDADAFLKKYPRPNKVDMADIFVIVEKDGSIWISVDGNKTFHPATLANFEKEFERIKKENTFKNPNPDMVFVHFETQDQIEKCAQLVEILSKTYASDKIVVFSLKRTVPPPPAGVESWGYNVNTDKDKYVAIQVNADNKLMYTAYNVSPVGEPVQKKATRTVGSYKELKADLEKFYPGAGSKVKYSVDIDRTSSIRMWREMEVLMADLKYTRAEANKGPANMTRRDSIDYIILGKYGDDSGRKRHIKNMQWYNENKNKDEFFRMAFVNGQLSVCKGNDASKLAPIAFDDLVPFFKANCPDGNERSAIVLLELPMDDESVSVEFLDKLLTKMEGWITTFTKRLYVSPIHIE